MPVHIKMLFYVTGLYYTYSNGCFQRDSFQRDSFHSHTWGQSKGMNYQRSEYA